MSRVQLQSEGIAIPNDLVDVHEEDIKGIIENLRRSRERIIDPNRSATEEDTINTPLFMLATKSQLWLTTILSFSL